MSALDPSRKYEKLWRLLESLGWFGSLWFAANFVGFIYGLITKEVFFVLGKRSEFFATYSEAPGRFLSIMAIHLFFVGWAAVEVRRALR
jgi:hypothetical protein